MSCLHPILCTPFPFSINHLFLFCKNKGKLKRHIQVSSVHTYRYTSQRSSANLAALYNKQFLSSTLSLLLYEVFRFSQTLPTLSYFYTYTLLPCPSLPLDLLNIFPRSKSLFVPSPLGKLHWSLSFPGFLCILLHELLPQ